MPNDGSLGDQRPRARRPRSARSPTPALAAERHRLHHPRHAVARLPLPRHRGVPPEEARHRRQDELRVLRHPPAVLGVRLRPADGRRVHAHRHVQAHPARRRGAPQPLARLHDARPRRHGAVRRRRRRVRARPDGDRRSARRHHLHVRARRRHRRDGPLPQDLRDRAAAVRRLRRAAIASRTRSCTRRWTASACS